MGQWDSFRSAKATRPFAGTTCNNLIQDYIAEGALFSEWWYKAPLVTPGCCENRISISAPPPERRISSKAAVNKCSRVCALDRATSLSRASAFVYPATYQAVCIFEQPSQSSKQSPEIWSF